MRLFVAVEFESRVCDAIQSAIDNFPLKNPPWRWSARDTWHLTLKFLGETTPTAVEVVSSALAESVKPHEPFDISLGRLGGFPNLEQPRVLFFRAESGVEPLAALARDIEASLFTNAGIARDDRPFRAHVTVARLKTRLSAPVAARLTAVPPLAEAAQRVGGIALIHSRLSSQGARYERLKQFALPTAS